jgi:hypothetical protein
MPKKETKDVRKDETPDAPPPDVTVNQPAPAPEPAKG